jgi:S1-C subfamily serine protease
VDSVVRLAVSRRLLAAGLAAVVVLLAAVAVLAVRLTASGTPAHASAAPSPAPSATASPTTASVYQKVRPSVVLVTAGDKLGSGVVVADDGTILTANHVISGAKQVTVQFFDGTKSAATVTSADKVHDIATLMPASLPSVVVPTPLGGGAGVGTPVVAIGNPLGLDDSVSAGVISGLNRSADTSDGSFSGLIQFDAAVNPGSSGGPLLNDQGLIVGIVVSIANPGHEDAFAGIGFAVPIGTAIGGRGGAPQI